MSQLDKRLHAFRDDLADENLRGQVGAKSFVKATQQQIQRPLVSVKGQAGDAAEQVTQALYGELFNVFEEKNGWCWGLLSEDGYVGYIRADHLGPVQFTASHKITVPLSFIFPRADIKSSPVDIAPLGTKIAVVAEEGDFFCLSDGRFVFRTHARELSHTVPDFVDVAECYLTTPYLWGGKTALGIDCSGLVQLSLQAAGVRVGRDSDMQAEMFGQDLALDDLSVLRRGDLIFWKGHVGIMVDPKILIHATGYHMMTVKEPLSEVIARSDKRQSPVVRIKRYCEGV